MRDAASLAEIVDAVQQRLTSGCHLVGIDGFTGCGKTTLGCALAEALNGMRVSVDCYIDRDIAVEDYRQKIRRADLGRELQQLREAFAVVVVDAVCLLDVLSDVGQQVDTLVYVKRISPQAIWNDGLDLEAFSADAESASGAPWVDRQVLRYHEARRPHEHADIVYGRVESSPLEA